MKPEVNEWLQQARMNYMVARHLFDTCHPMPIEIIGFHCQQAAEKAVKALIVAQNGIEVPQSHDISFLLDRLPKRIEIDVHLYEFAGCLTLYSVSEYRPFDMGLEPRHASSALYYAEEILAWVENII